MFLPIRRPEDLRFHLFRIGIDPSNDTEVVCGYGCLRLLEHIVRLRNWRLPFAAYKNEEAHRILAGVFPETTETIDRNLEVPDFWKTFSNVYSAVTEMPVETVIRNVCPNFVTDPNACIQMLSTGEFENVGVPCSISRCLYQGQHSR